MFLVQMNPGLLCLELFTSTQSNKSAIVLKRFASIEDGLKSWLLSVVDGETRNALNIYLCRFAYNAIQSLIKFKLSG